MSCNSDKELYGQRADHQICQALIELEKIDDKRIVSRLKRESLMLAKARLIEARQYLELTK
jgi:hypothetical protein